MTALVSGQFAVPGTASDLVTSELLAVIARYAAQATQPSPSASMCHATATKAAPKCLAASKKQAAASKEVKVESLKFPAPLSPILPKPSKGKAITRAKPT